MKAVDNLFSVYAGDGIWFSLARMVQANLLPSACQLTLIKLFIRQHTDVWYGPESKRKEILQQVGAVIERLDLYNISTAYENLNIARMSGLYPEKNAGSNNYPGRVVDIVHTVKCILFRRVWPLYSWPWYTIRN